MVIRHFAAKQWNAVHCLQWYSHGAEVFRLIIPPVKYASYIQVRLVTGQRYAAKNGGLFP